ncbi:MAG: hypothetical protein GY810_29205 [Aureispira sp.]|nr:hypothetical protein [Aureispira sp.]
MKNLYVVVAMLLGFLAVSCGTSPEAQKNQWNSNKKRLTRLQAEYPNFKTALAAVLTDAEAKWTSAEGVSGEEAQIEAMQGANSAASPQFVKDLDGLNKKMEDLKDLMTDVQQHVADYGDAAAARVAASEANNTLATVEGGIRTASASDANSANAITKGWTSKLESASKRLKKVQETAQKKKDDKKAADDKAKADDDKKAAADEEAKKPIKCAGCGTMNEAGSLKCSGCTAPLD